MNRPEPKHVHCEHILKFCDHCDVAYCKKCDKEWGAPCALNHWYPSIPTLDTNTITTLGYSQIDGSSNGVHTAGACPLCTLQSKEESWT